MLAAVGAFGIVFMNLSLQINSISFYQITKLCIIPTGKKIPLFKKKSLF